MQAANTLCKHSGVQRARIGALRCNARTPLACNLAGPLLRTAAGRPHPHPRDAASPASSTRSRWQLRAVEEKGGVPHYEGSVVAAPHHEFAIVVARFNDLVTGRLLDGALAAFKRHGVEPDRVTVAWVPGSFELPLVAKTMAKSGKFAGVVAIGAVIKGATSHYDAVVNGATGGILGASQSTGVPIIFGVLTCDSMEQGLDRAGGKVGNKGGEAAVTAIEMANLLDELRESGCASGPWAE